MHLPRTPVNKGTKRFASRMPGHTFLAVHRNPLTYT
jgi:hypothetical protein